MKKLFSILLLMGMMSCSVSPKITEWNYDPFIDNKKFGKSSWGSDIDYTFKQGHKVVTVSSGSKFYLKNVLFGDTKYDFNALEVRLYYTNTKYEQYPNFLNKQEFTIVQHRVSEPITTFIYDFYTSDSEYMIHEK